MEPSHEPCPMCGAWDEDERITDVKDLAEQAINDLRFLNLGFIALRGDNTSILIYYKEDDGSKNRRS